MEMFDNLEEVVTARVVTVKRKSQFKMRVLPEKHTILFSADQFTDMDIQDNSLSQFNDVKNNRVFLSVMPGNSGTFAKTTLKGKKGKRFKNVKLVDKLIEFGYDFNNIDLVLIGNEGGKSLYQITGNGAEVMESKIPIDADAPNEPVITTPMPNEEMSQGAQDMANYEAQAEPQEQQVEHGVDVQQEEAIEDALANQSPQELEF